MPEINVKSVVNYVRTMSEILPFKIKIMNWYIGQDVVAIRNQLQGDFKKGDVFTIKALRGSTCACNEVEIDIGNREDTNTLTNCPTCKTKYSNGNNINWYSELSFAPLDSIADISALTEVLTKEIYQV